jgi:hypothetical protein
MWIRRVLRLRPAGLAALSVVAGVVVAVMTNVVTDEPGPAVVGGLIVATVVTALLAAVQHRADTGAGSATEHVQLADGGRIDRSRLDIDPDTAARTRQEARRGGSISDSSIVVRRDPGVPRPGPPRPGLPAGDDG